MELYNNLKSIYTENYLKKLITVIKSKIIQSELHRDTKRSIKLKKLLVKIIHVKPKLKCV